MYLFLNRRTSGAHGANRSNAGIPRDIVRRPASRLLLLGCFTRNWRGPQQLALLIEHHGVHCVQTLEHGPRDRSQHLGNQCQVLAISEEVTMCLEERLATAELECHAAEGPHVAGKTPL